MQVVVITDEVLKQELVAQGVQDGLQVNYLPHPEVRAEKAGAVIDLLFENDPTRVQTLWQISAGLVVINSVTDTLAETDPGFVRVNGWNTFLQSGLIESACLDAAKKAAAEALFGKFNKQLHWLPDEPGFVTARVVSMIINEAFYAREEAVSTEEEMNTAMKLGTNYPYGPFEWVKKIGREKVQGLLKKLSLQDQRYEPAASLCQPRPSD